MAEFHGIFLLFSNAGIAYRGDGWWGGVGWEKTILVDHRGSGSNLRSPLPNWHPPLVPLF